MRNLLLSLSLLFSVCACQPNTTKSKTDIVCTTGIIGDAVNYLVGDTLNVVTLMGPGVDPHLYKATQGDIQQLSEAHVIVHNGLHLEGKMTDIFEKLSNQKDIIKMSDALKKGDLINSTDFEGAQDPHIWFDVRLWNACIAQVSVKLQKIYPELASYIKNNETKYEQQLAELQNFCEIQMSLIPTNQRVIITAHDAFKYFGHAYSIEVRGLQGISTTAELGLQDVSNLVQYITDRKIKSIFVESSVPKKSIEAVIEGCQKRGHDVQLGGELFSDALGAANTPEGTYVGMVKHNVNTIVNALK